jgi:putative addiction module component (TIGR02574 family)
MTIKTPHLRILRLCCRSSLVATARPSLYAGRVTSQAKKLYEEALALPEQERLALMQALSDSFEPTSVRLSSEWTAEVGNRLAQIESGEVQLVEWADVEAKIRATLGRP